MAKFSRHKWWLLTVLLTVPLAALAVVPFSFPPADNIIHASQVNANFVDLDTRVSTLTTSLAALTTRVATLETATAVPRAAIRMTDFNLPDTECTRSAELTDCRCHLDEIAIGGGTFAGGQSLVINASESSFVGQATPNLQTIWRVACANAITNVRTLCNAPFAVCLKVK